MLKDTALYKFIEKRDEQAFRKLTDLRDMMSRWLEYTIQSFSHFTRHTVEHSDEIIEKLSLILFHDCDYQRPVIDLSPAEGLVIASAAYLHDAGMVVSDSEKAQLIQSDQWKNWTEKGGGANRFSAIENFRVEGLISDPALRNFLADVQLRQLIAEYIRIYHHLRVRNVFGQPDLGINRIFDDSVLLKTIEDVCVSHGLDSREIEDAGRYPERRTIRNQQVNVRFCAIALRLGDLLDLSHARACPFLMRAASPLPTESIGHWNQYRRFTHQLFTPDRIELTAECQDHNEHRILIDWCTMIAREITTSRTLMVQSPRHNNWHPPHVTLDEPKPTICIRPSSSARYRPYSWRFELDEDLIFERIVRDAYVGELAFVRELIQNSLDAQRVRMYSDLKKSFQQLPERSTMVDSVYRNQYPLKATVKNVSIVNPLSGETEEVAEISIDDSGCGMSLNVIRRFLLQVGRSYYCTEEFRKAFPFSPTSRFGIGFLSVFAESGHVIVETRPSDLAEEGSRITLTGPRNFILAETTDRQNPGTLVRVRMKRMIYPGLLTNLMTQWCARVEFPVEIDDFGKTTRIDFPEPEFFGSELEEIPGSNIKVGVRVFPFSTKRFEGEICILFRVVEGRETWPHPYYISKLHKEHPKAAVVFIPKPLVLDHGINASASPRDKELIMPLSELHTYRGYIYRIDNRGQALNVSLSRVHSAEIFDEELLEVRETYQEILDQHLNKTAPEDWAYRLSLASCFPMIEEHSAGLDPYWRKIQGCIRIFIYGQPKLVSIDELISEHIWLVSGDAEWLAEYDRAVWHTDIKQVHSTLLETALRSKSALDLAVKAKSWALLLSEGDSRLVLLGTARFRQVPILTSNKLDCGYAVAPGNALGSPVVWILSEKEPIVQWLVRLKEIAGEDMFIKLWQVVQLVFEPGDNGEWLKYLSNWDPNELGINIEAPPVEKIQASFPYRWNNRFAE